MRLHAGRFFFFLLNKENISIARVHYVMKNYFIFQSEIYTKHIDCRSEICAIIIVCGV